MATTRYGYGDQAAEAMCYELALPENGISPVGRELVVLVPGGNFLDVMLDQSAALLSRFFLAEGYAVACISYRSLTVCPWPVPIEDIAMALHTLCERHGHQFDGLTYTGFSAGAVAGALLLYSRAFSYLAPQGLCPAIQRFIGISGLYHKAAVPAEPVEAIRAMSRHGEDILAIIEEFTTPATATPALLVEGARDTFADRYAGTEQSHAEYFRQFLAGHGIPAKTAWVKEPEYSDHVGPLLVLAQHRHPLPGEIRRFFADTARHTNLTGGNGHVRRPVRPGTGQRIS